MKDIENIVAKNLTGTDDRGDPKSEQKYDDQQVASSSSPTIGQTNEIVDILWKMVKEDTDTSKDDTDTPLDEETSFLRSSLEDIDEIFTSGTGLDDLWNSDKAADLPSSQESIRQMIRDLITSEQQTLASSSDDATKTGVGKSEDETTPTDPASESLDGKKPSKKQPEEQVASIRRVVMGQNKTANNGRDHQSSSSSSADSSELSNPKKRRGNFSISKESSESLESNESPEESNEYPEDSWSSSGSASSDRSTSSDRSASRKKRRITPPEEKELLDFLDFGPFTEEKKVGLHFHKVSSESEQADGSDGGPASSSDDPKSASSEDDARPAKKRHLQDEQIHAAIKKKSRCEGLANQ